MPELQHTWGSDLTVDDTGDLATVDGTEEGQERILRRLLTNPQEYVWHQEYGAALARFLGQPMAASNIQAVVRSQIFKEQIVARNPAPVITVTGQPDNSVFVQIQYVDAKSGQQTILSFPVTAG